MLYSVYRTDVRKFKNEEELVSSFLSMSQAVQIIEKNNDNLTSPYWYYCKKENNNE